MAWSQAAVLLAIGCAGGFVNVMAGGGSLLTVPVMLWMGMTGPEANGTNRVALWAQSISATVSFFRQGLHDFRLSLSLAACSLPGTIVGAYYGTQLGGAAFNRVLAGVMLGVMTIMASNHRRKQQAAVDSPEAAKMPDPADAAPLPPAAQPVGWGRWVVAHLLMGLVGLYGGAIQAGIGFLIIPIMHRVLRLDLVRVNAYKAPIALVSAVAALAVFAAGGNVAWQAGAALALGNAIGGWLGSVCTVRRGERLIRIVLNVALVAMVIKLLATK